MSFWEDRFVNRPHASAIPSEPSNEGDDQASTPEYEAGQAWTSVPEHQVDEVAKGPIGFAAEAESDSAFEPDAGTFESEAIEPAVEPVVDEPVDEPAFEPGLESHEADEDENDDEDHGDLAASTEPGDAPAVEVKRRGLFRRRQAAPVAPEATAFDDEAAEADEFAHESDHTESEDAEPELVGNGHAWSYVPESTTAEDAVSESSDAYANDEIVAAHTSETAAAESEPANTVDDDADRWAQAAALIEAEDASAGRQKRRGLFRRRVPVAIALDEAAEDHDVQLENSENAEPEHVEPEFASTATEFVGNGRAWSYVPESIEAEDTAFDPADTYEADEAVAEYAAPESEAIEYEETAEEDIEDDLAASIEIDESPVVEHKRRGLFRRRVPVALAIEDEAAEDVVVGEQPGDEAGAIEDEGFENVPMYGTESTHAPAHDWSEAADEEVVLTQYEDSGAFVVGETDDSDAPAVDEPELTPEHEQHEVADEPETEFEPFEQTELDATEVAAEYESEPEPSFDVPVTSLQNEPVVLRKRNGGGSARGKKVVGLKVGASQIAAAVVTGSGERPELVDLARRALEPGVVVDGELRDPEALTHALKSFFKDHALPVKNVRLGLSSSRVGVRTFDIAGIEDEERFDNAVRFKAHEVLPVAAHESVLDYRVVEERYTESGEISRRVLLVVAPRDQVEPYIAACRNAGLRLAGLDLEAFGLLRAFVPPLGSRNRSDDSATVVAAIGHEASTLLVAGGGVCEFTRVFDWGGGALQEAIAEELGVPLMEAATILTHLSLSGPGRHLDSLDSETRSRALEAVRTRLTPFARELVSSLQFYQTQPESLGIREILITGGTSHLEGLADALHQMIGVSVSVGDPLGRVAVLTEIPVALDATIGSLAVPIGLAIEDEAARSINLLPKDSRQTRKRPNALAVALPVAAVVPIAALAFLFLGANSAARDNQTQLDAVRIEIAKLPEPTRANIDPALAGEQAQRATAVAQVLGSRLSWERVLGDISRVIPSGVSLTELAATAPQPTTPEVPVPTTEDASASSTPTPAPAPAPVAVPTTPTGVTVMGYAFDYASIARTLARIQAVPSLVNAQLQSATPTDLGQKRVIEFTIVADLATTGGAQ